MKYPISAQPIRGEIGNWRTVYQDDFLNFVAGTATQSGRGTGRRWVSRNATGLPGPAPSPNAALNPGYILFDLSGATTDVLNPIQDTLAATGGFAVGSGAIYVEALVYIVTLSTAVDEWEMQFGIRDGTPTNVIRMSYIRTTSVNWLIQTMSGGVGGQNSTSTPVSTGWNRLGVGVNRDGTTAEFFVNGASIGTLSNNIPSARIGFHLGAVKRAGSPAGVLGVDYVRVWKEITPGR